MKRKANSGSFIKPSIAVPAALVMSSEFLAWTLSK
jgi:hypothetical protein